MSDTEGGDGYITVKWDQVRFGDIVDGEGDPEKRRLVMTPELKERWEKMPPEMKEKFNRPVQISKEPFTRKWFNRGMEGGSPPTAAEFRQMGLSRLLSIAQDSFNKGSAAFITNVIVQNASALAQRILTALPGANGGNQQIIINLASD